MRTSVDYLSNASDYAEINTRDDSCSMTHVDLNMDIYDDKLEDNLESSDDGLDVSDEHYISSDQESYELLEVIEDNCDAIDTVANSVTDNIDHPDDDDLCSLEQKNAEECELFFLTQENNNNDNDNDNDSNDNNNNNNKKPFSIEMLTRALLIMATKLKRCLNYKDSEIISKLSDALSTSSSSRLSKYYLKKILYQYSTSIAIHHFCPKCHRHVGSQPSQPKKKEKLYCKYCIIDFDIKKNLEEGNIFIHLSLAEQLTQLFQNHQDSIINPAERLKSYAIKDIYDGQLYKQNINDMVSINFSLDGVPIFKSSNYSIYPLLYTLNELSPINRRKHIMLVSLWFGKGKPEFFSEYLKPFVSECKLLYENGFSYTIEGHRFTQKCRVLNCVCDSVQRPKMRGSTQYNGAFGCGLCLHPGKSIEKGRGYARVYPVGENKNYYGEGLRNHKDTLMHAENGKKGMKEKSILCDIPGFDIIHNIDVDWMHCIGLGVCRQFGDLWFNPVNSGRDFYYGAYLKQLDKVLTSYKPSLEVSRTPRKLSDRIHWKAHEWIIWLLFYSLPTLKPIFSKELLTHWSLLVEGVAILSKRSLMKSEIYYAEQILLEFVGKVETLYGEEFVSFNVHLTSHLALSVLNWGPVSTHSAFMYEDYNQNLQDYVQSSNGVPLQICDNFRLKLAVENLEYVCAENLSNQQKNYLDEFFGKNHQFDITCTLTKSLHLIGNSVEVANVRLYKLMLHRKIGIISDNATITYYTRARINDEIIHSTRYSEKKVKKRNSHTVLLNDQEVFEIEIFATVRSNTGVTDGFAIGTLFKPFKGHHLAENNINHLILLKRLRTEKIAIQMEQIQEKVTILDNERLNYLVACIHPSRSELLM